MNRNTRTALLCVIVLAAMGGAAYAAVPLYRMFCEATGFDGTVRRAFAAPAKATDRPITIRFDTNVRDLPWTFEAEQIKTDLKVGETGLAFFRVTNRGKTPLVGRAAYNVVPESAARYFQKLECFCFTDQTMQPGETREFPVAYFVDPQLATDQETRKIAEITLSYTFFPSAKPAKVSAVSTREPLGGRGSPAL